jgi:hypothetical protein
MNNRDEFTQQEAVLFAKALAKAQAEITRLEEALDNLGGTKDQYRNYWLEECEKTRALEAKFAESSALKAPKTKK